MANVSVITANIYGILSNISVIRSIVPITTAIIYGITRTVSVIPSVSGVIQQEPPVITADIPVINTTAPAITARVLVMPASANVKLFHALAISPLLWRDWDKMIFFIISGHY
jgi:hypothetical protein